MCILCTHTLSRLLSQYNQFLFSVPAVSFYRKLQILLLFNYTNTLLMQFDGS